MLSTLVIVGKTELTEAQGARVLAALERRRDVEHKGNVNALARELGKSQAALWQIFAHRTRPSLAMAHALASALRVPLGVLLRGPREEAADLAREAGVSEIAIQRVLAEHEPVGYRPPLYYVDRMRAVEALGEGSSEIVSGPPPSVRAG